MLYDVESMDFKSTLLTKKESLESYCRSFGKDRSEFLDLDVNHRKFTFSLQLTLFSSSGRSGKGMSEK